MTKKSAAKIAARARQQLHGGKYQHHLRVVTSGPQGPFERLVHHIIGLAKARFDEDAATPPRPWSYRRALMPAEAALLGALKALPYSDLRKIEVLMYAGQMRDDDVVALGRSLHRDTPEITVDVIFDKAPLHKYLAEGLRLAKAQRVGLETEFG